MTGTITEAQEKRHMGRAGNGRRGSTVPAGDSSVSSNLIKGKDVTLNKGMIFETFTDQDHTMNATFRRKTGVGNHSLAVMAR